MPWCHQALHPQAIDCKKWSKHGWVGGIDVTEMLVCIKKGGGAEDSGSKRMPFYDAHHISDFSTHY
jgi:hypothetical protein